MEDRVRAIIVELNSLNLGEISSLEAKLEQAGVALRALGQDELAARVDEARGHLRRADVAAFRRSLQQVLSKLGHVRT